MSVRRRSLTKPAQRRRVGIERAMVICDLHVPYHDPRAVGVALAVAEDIQPEILFLDGDACDFYALSRFSKEPIRELQLQDELDETVDILGTFRKALPSARFVFIRGNHEHRLDKYLCTPGARGLRQLRALTIPELLHFEELNIEYVEGSGREAWTEYGKVHIGHFDIYRKWSAYAAKELVMKHAESVIQAHTHKLGTHYRRYPGGRTVVGIESGCLCDLNPEYVSDPDWQHGFTIITKRVHTNRFHIKQVPIIDYECMVTDVLYSA